MAMAGGAKVEVLAFGEIQSENPGPPFTLGFLGTLEHFRYSKEVLEGLSAAVDPQDCFQDGPSEGPGLL